MYSHCFDDLWSTFLVVKHKLIDQVDQQLNLTSIGPNAYVLEQLYYNTANTTH